MHSHTVQIGSARNHKTVRGVHKLRQRVMDSDLFRNRERRAVMGTLRPQARRIRMLVRDVHIDADSRQHCEMGHARIETQCGHPATVVCRCSDERW
jgi:hypothetical protein